MSILLAFVAGLLVGLIVSRLRRPVGVTTQPPAPAITIPPPGPPEPVRVLDAAGAAAEVVEPAAPASDRPPPADVPTAEQPPTPEPTAAETTPAPAIDPAMPPLRRLQLLTEQLNTAGEASIRPPDLLDNALFMETVALLQGPEVNVTVVAEHAVGLNWMLSSAAFAALADRPDGETVATEVLERIHHLHPWPLYYALRFLERLDSPPPLGAVPLACAEWWSEHPFLKTMLAEHFARRVNRGHAATFGGLLGTAGPAEIAAADVVLEKVNHPAARLLRDELSRFHNAKINREFLQTLGRFVDSTAQCELLVEHPAIQEPLAHAESCVLDAPHRSLLVVGDPGMGKTSFIAMLGKRVTREGWVLFEAGGADLQAGQKYIGELEQRMRQLSAELAIDKKVLWHAPDFLQLALSGAHEAQSATLLDQVLPAIAAGRLLLVSEITPAALNTVLQRRPAIRTAVELVRLRPLTDQEVPVLTRQVAARLATHATLHIGPDEIAATTYLARHYLGTTQAPGSTIDLLKHAVQRASARDASRVEREDVLASVAQLTGMPQQILDDRERVDLAALRTFFASRVIGQDEAVEAVVDRIAMLKAGLTDPGKPVAVFLFAGPTGTGKTELAKTLAAFLFGSADRLIRLDMSEFQTADSMRTLVGDPGTQGAGNALTDRVRRQPFSIVLLDEFEKAHAQIWDVFLQVFDDGRLTDVMGHTVDLRHCIIILTSNLGSTIKQDAGPGFVAHAAGLSQPHVMKAINQSFRPEFVNRIDRIIVFRPLGREQMRSIVQKELALVLERRGLRHREWAVEWEASALEFLLDKGFSPAMGARPLKRAIDQHLLAPLAATVVEHRFPEGDQFLFVRSDGRSLQVEFVDPNGPDREVPLPGADAPARASATPSLPRMMLQPAGTSEERAALGAALQRLEERLSDEQWTAQAERLAARMQRPDFWDVPDRRVILSQLEVMDRVRAAAAGARSLASRLDRSSAGRGAGRYSRDLVARLSSQLFVLSHGIEDALGDAPVEVVLSVDPLLERGTSPEQSASWCDRLAEMYRKWSARRGMQVTTIAQGRRLLVISGFGAARLLAGESGLHIQDEEEDGEATRIIARVSVRPTPADLPESAVEQHTVLSREIDKAPASSTVVRRYRGGASPVVRDLVRGWRTGRAELVFDGHFDVIGELS